MVIRSERHRELLLASINACQFPGSILEDVVGLKAEIMMATIDTPAPPNGNGSPPAPPEGTGDRSDEALLHRNG